MKTYNNKTLILIALSLFLSLSFGCRQNTDKNKIQTDSTSNRKKIMNLSPPFFSMLLLAQDNDINIIGTNPRTFDTANKDIINEIYPAYNTIETSMVNNDFNINIETVLTLAPDQIFYYGEFQNKGIEKLPIQSRNIFLNQSDPEILTIEWEKIVADELNLEYSGKMKAQWDISDQISVQIKNRIPLELKGLFIFNNINGKITVAGNNSYGDHFLRKANLMNVAKDFNGEYEVNIEQIYKWNPDCIFIFLGNSAQSVMNGSSNQNLSSLRAVKEKQIYDIPRGIYAWGSPCSESPLTSLWMMAKIYPEFYSMKQFRTHLKQFYKDLYNKDIDDILINSIIG